MYKWPEQWKLELVTVILKSAQEASFEECRNLSCTPLFSKIMETYMMDCINKEVNINYQQYGGVKGCGTENLLLEAWKS